MAKRVFTRTVLAVVCLLCAGLVWAFATGSVAGIVKDSTGAFMPNVKVTLTNNATNAQVTTTTDSNGEFQFQQLAPSTYSLVVEAKGFKKAVSNTLVQVDQITHAEITLAVGDVSESVQVEGVAPLLENDKSTLSSVVDTRSINSMPLNARQFMDLALLTP